jgi:hypothetical protein
MKGEIMKKKLYSFFLIVLIILGLLGCAVKVAPPLSSSLGMDAFEQMKKIEIRDASLALYIDPKIKDLKADQNIRMGEFTFYIGNAFSVKLIKALAYNFRTIYILDQLDYAALKDIDAVMIVGLQDVDVNLGVSPGFAKVASTAETRLAIRAEIKDVEEQKTVWVGTTQAKESGKHEELGQMTYQEAGRGFAISIDSVVDKAIGDIIQQMSKSQNLQKYFIKWQQRHKGET